MKNYEHGTVKSKNQSFNIAFLNKPEFFLNKTGIKKRIESLSFVSFLKIRKNWSESKVTAKTKGSKYLLVSINPHGLTLSGIDSQKISH